MSPTEHTKAPTGAQLLFTTSVEYGSRVQLQILPGLPVLGALDVARYLTAGVGLMAGRIADGISEHSGLAYFDEMRSLAFLADTSAALIQSVQAAIECSVEPGRERSE